MEGITAPDSHKKYQTAVVHPSEPTLIHQEFRTMRPFLTALSILLVVPASMADDLQLGTPCPLAAQASPQSAARVGGYSTPAPLLTLNDVESARVGLDGFCPVCIVKGGKWERGTEQFQTVYDGITWRFPSAEAMEMFTQNPAAFVPAMNGDCIVCYAKAGKRIAGDIRHGVFFRNRVYLFPSPEEREVFVANPTHYENADLALNGDCIVCRVKARKDVPGKPEFTEVHNGLRYLFPSAAEQKMFREQPSLFVNEEPASALLKSESAPKALPKDVGELSRVSFTGNAACAACELGIRPLGHPEELGMAIRTNDGRTIVIEEAHLRFPAEYQARFEHQEYEVQGAIVRSKGNVIWISPSSLTLVR